MKELKNGRSHVEYSEVCQKNFHENLIWYCVVKEDVNQKNI